MKRVFMSPLAQPYEIVTYHPTFKRERTYRAIAVKEEDGWVKWFGLGGEEISEHIEFVATITHTYYDAILGKLVVQSLYSNGKWASKGEE